MKHLLVIYHTQSHKTQALADSVVEGATTESSVEVRVKLAFDSGLDDLLWADAIIFGTPENFGYMSGALKDFFDRTFYPAEPYQLSKPYAIFVSAGNDGTGAVREVDRICKGYPLKRVADPVIVRGELTDEGLRQASELGQTMAAAVAMGAI